MNFSQRSSFYAGHVYIHLVWSKQHKNSINLQGSYRSGKSEKSWGICVAREWSGENDLGSCRLQISLIFCVNIKKQENLWISLNVQKLKVFQFQVGFAPCPPLFLWLSDQGFTCHLHIAALIPFHYFMILLHFWHLCNEVIVSIRSGKLSFHDYKKSGNLATEELQESWFNSHKLWGVFGNKLMSLLNCSHCVTVCICLCVWVSLCPCFCR